MKIRKAEWLVPISEGDYRAKLRSSAQDGSGVLFCNVVESAGEYIARHETRRHCIVSDPAATPMDAIKELIRELETVSRAPTANTRALSSAYSAPSATSRASAFRKTTSQGSPRSSAPRPQTSRPKNTTRSIPTILDNPPGLAPTNMTAHTEPARIRP